MIPAWLQAIVLGVVQGVTEFMPVSSSGHLVLLPYLFGWQRPGLAFDVALHVGTAGAIVTYFRVELLGMLRAIVQGGHTPAGRLYRRLAVLLVVASVPVAVVGLTLKETFERIFETPVIAAFMLLVTAAVLVGGEKLRDRRVAASRSASTSTRSTGSELDEVLVGEDPEDPAGRDLEHVGLREAALVGLAQILALFPGMSRAGTTIMAGVAAGMTREAATRFSFLLALPALAGAALLSLPDLAEPGPYSGVDIALGVVAAFVAGYLAIAFLVRLVAHTSLRVFVAYLVVAATLGLLGSLMLGPPRSGASARPESGAGQGHALHEHGGPAHATADRQETQV